MDMAIWDLSLTALHGLCSFFYSLTFYGLNSSLSSNLNVVYAREEDVCCQHCAPGRKKYSGLQLSIVSFLSYLTTRTNYLQNVPVWEPSHFLNALVVSDSDSLNVTVVETTEQSKIVDYLTTSPSNKHCPTNQINMVKIFQRLYQSLKPAKTYWHTVSWTVEQKINHVVCLNCQKHAWKLHKIKERQVLIGWSTVGYLEQSRENTH